MTGHSLWKHDRFTQFVSTEMLKVKLASLPAQPILILSTPTTPPSQRHHINYSSRSPCFLFASYCHTFVYFAEFALHDTRERPLVPTYFGVGCFVITDHCPVWLRCITGSHVGEPIEIGRSAALYASMCMLWSQASGKLKSQSTLHSKFTYLNVGKSWPVHSPLSSWLSLPSLLKKTRPRQLLNRWRKMQASFSWGLRQKR